MSTAPSAPGGGGKNVNGDFVHRPKLMNSPVFLGKICRFQGSETIKNDSKLNRGLALY